MSGVEDDQVGVVDEDGDVFLRVLRKDDGSVQLMMAGTDDETGELILHELDEGPVAAPMGGRWEKITLVDPANFPALRAALGAPEGADVVAHLAAHFTGEASWEVTRRIAEAGVPVEEEHG